MLCGLPGFSSGRLFGSTSLLLDLLGACCFGLSCLQRGRLALCLLLRLPASTLFSGFRFRLDFLLPGTFRFSLELGCLFGFFLGISLFLLGTSLFLSSHLPGPAPKICHTHAAKVMLLNRPTAKSGSWSKATVMPLLPVAAVVGSQPVCAGAQAAGATIGPGAGVLVVAEGGIVSVKPGAAVGLGTDPKPDKSR